MKFLVNGEINLGEPRKFSKEIDAKTENDARQRVYSFFGSNNGIKRSAVSISSVSKV